MLTPLVSTSIVVNRVVLLVGLAFLLESCSAPSYDRSAEVYVRNESGVPLTVSFNLAKKDVILDTVWWRGGQQHGTYVVGSYIVRALKLHIEPLTVREVFASSPQSLLLAGSLDTVFREPRFQQDTAWVDERDQSLATGPQLASAPFLRLERKVALNAQMPEGKEPLLVLKPLTEDSLAVILHIAPNDSLLVASKSEAFHASDPTYDTASDFALTRAQVHWQTRAGRKVWQPLPAKARLDALLLRAPAPASTKSYYVHDVIMY